MRISNSEHVYLKWRTCVSQIGFQGFKLLSDVSFQQEESGGLRGATPLRHAKKKGANLAPFNNMLGLVLRNEFF